MECHFVWTTGSKKHLKRIPSETIVSVHTSLAPKLHTLVNFKGIGSAAYQSTGSSVLNSYGKEKSWDIHRWKQEGKIL